MTNHHAHAEALEKAAAKRLKDQHEYHDRIGAIGDETRSAGAGMTRNGRMRRHVMRQNDSLLAAVGGSRIDLGAIFLSTHGAKPLLDGLQNMWDYLKETLHIKSSNTDPARHVELQENSPDSYVYHTALIGTAVKEKLDREVAEVKALQQACDAEYETGQYGPFSHHFNMFRLRDQYEMRVHPVTHDIAFSQSRIQTLQQEMRCTGGTCPITVFSAVPTSSLRGLHVKAADPNSEHAVKVTTSDQAVERITAPPVRVTPPQFNFVQ